MSRSLPLKRRERKYAMDWDKLKVFHAAAEAGSFTHAGEQLGLSQSAVSRQVSALEQELSVSLFHRHARGLILTEQGDLLFPIDACRRAAWPVSIGGVAAGQRARAGALGVAVPSPCARPHSHRAGRPVVSDRRMPASSLACLNRRCRGRSARSSRSSRCRCSIAMRAASFSPSRATCCFRSTHAGEQLGLSQSAVSRQVSALEQELSVSLFHRHARGLILTEQGDLLFRTAHDVFMQLQAARAKLTDSRERPNGDLRVTTTPGIGIHWLTPRLGEFLDLYPEVHITLITTDEELDLAMREADVAIRLRQPTQPDLIQRKLFSVHFHVYASPEYLKRFGTPRTFDDLDNHRVLVLGGNVPPYLQRSRWLVEVARDGKGPRVPHLVINNILGILRACQRGIGIAMLPDYLVEENGGLVQLFGEAEPIALDAYFVYPEELKTVARVQAFRDFLVANAQRWNF